MWQWEWLIGWKCNICSNHLDDKILLKLPQQLFLWRVCWWRVPPERTNTTTVREERTSRRKQLRIRNRSSHKLHEVVSEVSSVLADPTIKFLTLWLLNYGDSRPCLSGCHLLHSHCHVDVFLPCCQRGLHITQSNMQKFTRCMFGTKMCRRRGRWISQCIFELLASSSINRNTHLIISWCNFAG